jgi:hypothetical protein
MGAACVTRQHHRCWIVQLLGATSQNANAWWGQAVVGTVLADGLGQVPADQLQHSPRGVVDRLALGRASGQALAVAKGAADGAQMVGQACIRACRGDRQVSVYSEGSCIGIEKEYAKTGSLQPLVAMSKRTGPMSHD